MPAGVRRRSGPCRAGSRGRTGEILGRVERLDLDARVGLTWRVVHAAQVTGACPLPPRRRVCREPRPILGRGPRRSRRDLWASEEMPTAVAGPATGGHPHGAPLASAPNDVHRRALRNVTCDRGRAIRGRRTCPDAPVHRREKSERGHARWSHPVRHRHPPGASVPHARRCTSVVHRLRRRCHGGLDVGTNNHASRDSLTRFRWPLTRAGADGGHASTQGGSR